MPIINNWEENLHYVNQLGLVHPTMPIGWKQNVLFENIKAVETVAQYPMSLTYSRKHDELWVNGKIRVKAIHS